MLCKIKLAEKFLALKNLKLNKMKIYFFKKHNKPIFLFIFLISFIPFKGDLIRAEYLLEELQIDSSTKTEEDSSDLPTNPFEIVEMIRRYNSLNNATSPSKAIDDALKSFESLEEK